MAKSRKIFTSLLLLLSMLASLAVLAFVQPPGVAYAAQTFTGYITSEDDFYDNLGADTASMIHMKLMAESGLGITFQQPDGTWVFYYFDGTFTSGGSPWTFNGTGSQLTAWNIVTAQVNSGGGNNPVPVTVTGSFAGTASDPVNGDDGYGISYQVLDATSIAAVTNPDTDATLDSLSVSQGTLSPSFATGTTTYSVTLPAGTATVPTVSVTVNDTGKATYAITQAGSVTGSATVKVTAQDGTTTQTYTVKFSVATPVTLQGYITTEWDFKDSLKADTASMIHMKVMADSGLGVTFQQNGDWVFYYFDGTISDGNSVGSNGKWAFDGTGSQLAAWNIVTDQVNNNGGSNPVHITVTGSFTGNTEINPGNDPKVNGSTASDGIPYPVLTVTSIVSSNASLSNLAVDQGTLSPAFAATNLTYTDSVAYGVTSINVTPTPESSNATYVLQVNNNTVDNPVSLSSGANTIDAVVTAQDGTKQTYVITVTVAGPDTDDTLSALTYNGTTVPSFDPKTTTYNVVLAAGTATVPTVSATVYDTGKATGVITQATALPGSATVAVTAQDGTTAQTYTVNFTVGETPSGTGGGTESFPILSATPSYFEAIN